MTTVLVPLEVHVREAAGTRAARRMRKEGLIPGVVYGQGDAPRAFYVVERELRSATAGGQRLNAIFELNFEGETTDVHAVVKDYQVHPTRSRLLHLDFQQIRLDQPIQSSVTIEPVGHAPGVTEGGILNVVTRELSIEALPLEIPDLIELSIEGMVLGDSRTVADLVVPEGVTVLDDPETVVLTVAVTRVTLVEPEPEEGEELEEGEEGEEGEDVEGEGEGDDAPSSEEDGDS
ncbi:MAG: 50S ribosomal protein L25 [Gaiellaceae bacterium]